MSISLQFILISNNNDELPRSPSDEEFSNENTANTNQLIKWTIEDLVTIDDNDEKIYEDLCYVTISSSFPLEVYINFIPCYCG